MSDRLYLGTRKGLFVVQRQAGGWEVAGRWFLGAQVPMILPDARDRRLYAAVGHGHFGAKLHVSGNGGRSWEEIAAPAYPPKPDDAVEVVCPMRKTPIPWSLELIWSLEAGGPDQPGRLWCGTIPGGLFRSGDRGATWQLVGSLWNRPERARWFGGGYDYPGIHSICVDPRDSRQVGVAISCGGYWMTRDDGETWSNQAHGMRAAYLPPEQALDPDIQDPHRVVRCAGSPDVLWCQHHNGVFRSVDGGRSWVEIPAPGPTGFGFAVAAHPRDGNTAWFVPAVKDEERIPVDGRLVVTRTSDGGRSFEVLDRGLPQKDAYDLVYRHALAVDESGERLAFGSTTGSLWISDDGGDSWVAVNHHLPPIFSVRWE